MTGASRARALMIQGAGSNVGKSMIVAGLARAFAQDGLRVRPFKPQNMSNNAAVTSDGGEIGRAQALQARAAGVPLHSDMNPVLLKPESETGAQVIVQGQRFATQKARDYGKLKPVLLQKVVESYTRLATQADLVLIEGAGSPAETNLRARDIANMGFAEAVHAPVVLVGDINRGGVIAQLVGTQAVLDDADADRIKGFLVNKFRGDVTLFDEGAADIARRTGWHDVGTIPWFDDAWKLPPEDMLDLAAPQRGHIRIAVPVLNRMANLDDLDPLAQEPDVHVDIIRAGHPLPGDADLVLLGGSKATLADLQDFRRQGWDIDLAAHVRRGGHVMGICGGYQMLGHELSDPEGIEGPPGSTKGLGLLDVTTTMETKKQLSDVSGRHFESDTPVHGYEIHIGRTDGPDCARPWLEIDGRDHGAASANGRILGCYVHGIFASDRFRRAFLSTLGTLTQHTLYEASVDSTLDSLADHLRQSLDLPALLEIAQPIMPEQFELNC